MLAFACAFTMFAGAASYSDKADIKATDRCRHAHCSGRNSRVTNDGSFKPNTTVTRAQMAKMIFTITGMAAMTNANRPITSLPTNVFADTADRSLGSRAMLRYAAEHRHHRW